MSRAKLDAARELIRERKYFEARAILRTLPNDPTARKWLTKLEEIAPEKKTLSNKWIIAATAVLSVLLVVLVLFIILNGTARDEDSQVAQLPTLMALPTTTPTDTPTPTITPSPTATFTPLPTQTFTPTPSKTPVPSNTPSPTPECSIEVWWETAEPLVVEFLDEAETGGQTARISLSSVILEMRQTQRSFERLEYGSCVASVRDTISSGMDQAVNGFNSFLGESEYVAINQLDQATNYFADAYQLLERAGIFADIRMADTATFIWGGSSPNSVVQGQGRQLAGCNFEAYWNAIEPILTEFSATSASTNIYELYAQMLLFKQLIEAVDYPECFAQGRDYLLTAVDNMILAAEAQMDGNFTTSQRYLDLAETSMDLMTQELQRLQRLPPGSNT